LKLAPKQVCIRDGRAVRETEMPLWADLVEWGRRSRLKKGNELASEIDFTIAHCVNTIEETIALIRENRAVWLAPQPPK
jgi:hypothetical protein